MSVHQSEQCEGASKTGGQCRLMTSVDHRCWIHSQKDKMLRVKKSNIPGAGKGLFASKWEYTLRGQTRPGKSRRILFRKGDRVCSYKGDVISTDTLNRRYPGDVNALYVLSCPNERRHIDARKTTSCFGRYANSNRNKGGHKIASANGELKSYNSGKGWLIARKRIRQGDEILVSYGDGPGLGYKRAPKSKSAPGTKSKSAHPATKVKASAHVSPAVRRFGVPRTTQGKSGPPVKMSSNFFARHRSLSPAY